MTSEKEATTRHLNSFAMAVLESTETPVYRVLQVQKWNLDQSCKPPVWKWKELSALLNIPIFIRME